MSAEIRRLALELDPIERVCADHDQQGNIRASEYRLSEAVADYGWDGAEEFPEVRRFLDRLGAIVAEQEKELKRVYAQRDEAEARIEKALAVCNAGEWQATRWEQPFPVPAWVTDVRAALTGENGEVQ